MSKIKSPQDKNVINRLLNILPDNRPVTSLQIVEDFEKCPTNFFPVSRTYDQDSDADLWRETNILFGRRTGRYLCLSKSEGLPEYIIETLKVIGEKELPPEGFSLLTRTADTEQRAWRKRQIVYKLSKRGIVSQAVTDIILCSKSKYAPAGFLMAGEINGIIICYKMGIVTHRPPPDIPVSGSALIKQFAPTSNDITIAIQELTITSTSLKPIAKEASHNNNDDYEQLQSSYKISSPKQTAPTVPQLTRSFSNHTGTLCAHTELEGVPFVINPYLQKTENLEIPLLLNNFNIKTTLDYDFQLERQLLCTTKSNNANNKNPFFH